MSARLPPTSETLSDERTRPYFLWWTTTTVGDLRRLLADDDPATRAYWMGSLLREANTRDVWLFVRPRDIRALWPRVRPFLGRSRKLWSFLLGMPDEPWPPRVAHG